MEIYNEKIKDLLNPDSILAHDVKLVAKNSKELHVTNLTVSY